MNGRTGWTLFISIVLLYASCERSSTLQPDGSLNTEVVRPPLEVDLEEIVVTEKLTNISFHPNDSMKMYLITMVGKVLEYNAQNKNIQLLIDSRDFQPVQRLIDMEFHPNFENNGWVFLSYSYFSGNKIASGLSKIELDVSSLDSRPIPVIREEMIMNWDQFTLYDHTVDEIEFGPNDGYLYIATGDGGCCADPQNEAQNLESYRGKILRIDVNSQSGYEIPATNPFINNPNALDEIWAYGLRNPYKINFDKQTGDLFIFDVGENTWEEINFQPASSFGGENYGWKILEGNKCLDIDSCDTTNIVVSNPVLALKHGQSNSIIGGVLYRGRNIPVLYEHLIFGDFTHKKVWAIDFSSRLLNRDMLIDLTDSLNAQQVIFDEGVVAVKEDLSGEVYVVEHSGKVFKIVPK